MHFALITAGLPGPGYHGGALTCWGVLKQMLEHGHRATVVSLFDVSNANPYLETRQEQTDGILKAGAGVEFIEYHPAKLAMETGSFLSKKMNAVIGVFEEMFPWASLRGEMEKTLAKIAPDALFFYHFDALSVGFRSEIPKYAVVGDLWHLPSYFRWRKKPPSLKKYTLDYINYRLFMSQSSRFMLEMLRNCEAAGTFVGHYAPWYQARGIPSMGYVQTPVFDSLGPDALKIKAESESKSPRILMISANLGGTSTSSGLKVLMEDIVPELDSAYSRSGYEIHLLGKGKPQGYEETIDNHPAIHLRGRIVPPNKEFLKAGILLVPNPITLGVRNRILTAMSFATCVVAHAANAAGIPELEHGQNCLLAEDGPAIARLAIEALNDGTLRTRLRQNGRATYDRYFRDDVTAGRIVKTLETIARPR